LSPSSSALVFFSERLVNIKDSDERIMSATKLKAPPVAVPTLRSSAALVGTGLFHNQKKAASYGTPTISHQPEAAHVWLHDEGNTVFIDELVTGVQQFQEHGGVKQRPATSCGDASHHLEKVQSGSAAAVRVAAASPGSSKSGRARSPRPSSIAGTAVGPQPERKPWGFNQPATPRGRPQSPHPQTEPRRETQTAAALDRSPAATAEKPQKRSSSASSGAHSRTALQHVSPPTNRNSKTTLTGQSTSPKVLGLSAELLSSLNFHVKALDERTSVAEARAAAAEDRQRVMEKEMAAMGARHGADMAAMREKMLQLTAQLQYAMHWINNFDAMAARQNEEAFLDDDVSAMRGGGIAAADAQSGGRSAGGATASVIRRLDLSTESATFRMPPSPPMALEQK
jgi:hypothetical protein